MDQTPVSAVKWGLHDGNLQGLLTNLLPKGVNSCLTNLINDPDLLYRVHTYL